LNMKLRGRLKATRRFGGCLGIGLLCEFLCLLIREGWGGKG
jgi:hypothetical protein